MIEIPNLPEWLDHFVRQIPAGKVIPYGDVARLLGDVTAARYVAQYALQHEHTDDCGCHRLIRKTGEPGQYITGDEHEKIVRLRSEGVLFRGDVVNVDECRWEPEPSDYSSPLSDLLSYQDRVAGQVRESSLTRPVQFIAGVDLAYPEPGIGQAACAVLNAETLAVEFELIHRDRILFPYIPRYLAFRELPLLLSLWDKLLRTGPEPDLIFVDGNGLLHPRRAGIATCLGVELDKPTIGISKSLLIGKVPVGTEHERPVLWHDEQIATAITTERSGKPFYVSVGHQITLSEAVAWMHRAWLPRQHRLPEPIYQADRLSRVPPTG
ncbi:MAG: hypothetical protein CMJ46_14725 [Planctomyces sp.]|nr:hypothetical protein [Planctomyces sp.]